MFPVIVTINTSQHQLLGGGCVNQAFSYCKEATTQGDREEEEENCLDRSPTLV